MGVGVGTEQRSDEGRAIRLEIERQELLQVFKASQISTPLSMAVAVGPRTTRDEALSILESGGFDQAPVSDHGTWVGWVSQSALRRSAEATQVRAAFNSLTVTPIVSERSSIAEVLRHLARTGFVYTANGSGLVGFITPSDLERHAARNHFFVLVAGIEMLLSDIVRHRYSVEAIEQILSDEALPEVAPASGMWSAPPSLKARYLQAREKHSETHPVEYLYLGQLKDLVAQAGDAGLLEGYESSVIRDLEMVVALRPDVTHPTRSLIARRDAKALLAVAEAAERAHRALVDYLIADADLSEESEGSDALK